MQTNFIDTIVDDKSSRGKQLQEALQHDPDRKHRKAFWDYYFQQLCTLVGIKQNDLKVTLIAAWESDETHFRHFSIEPDFRIGSRKLAIRRNTGGPYEPAARWKPGLVAGEAPPRATRHKGIWTGNEAGDIFEYLFYAIMDYMYGPANNTDGISKLTPKEKARKDVETILCANWGVESILFDLVESLGLSGNDGGYWEIGFNQNANLYVSNSKHAWVTEPQLMVDGSEANENFFPW